MKHALTQSLSHNTKAIRQSVMLALTITLLAFIHLTSTQANAQTAKSEKEKLYTFTFNSIEVQSFVNILNGVAPKGSKLELVPVERPPVKMIYKDITWDEALNALAQKAGLVIKRNGNNILLIPKEEYDPSFK